MIKSLTETEKEIILMLIRGQNFRGISQWLCVEYSEYRKIKCSIFKKLKVTRITQLLPLALELGIAFDDK